VADVTQLAVEQEYFDHAAECRERSRATLIAAPASAAGPIAGASAVKRTVDKYLDRMPGPDEAVAVGRFKTEDETLYVGKRLIKDDDGEPLVINWQAKAAAPFYRATFDKPIGVLSKRSFRTESNRVLDFDEMIFADLAERVAELTSNERFGIDDTVLHVSIHGMPRICVQLTAGSGGSQGFPSMTARTASSAAVPWAAAESR
jgi:hypothetical protein